ncbi:PREDICTED: protein JTB-like [Acropora digitifera]|uniref:protein JTB-like n=1 Tax=Acropora digitifera TaxID=70779 RepID=UPI00077A5202|nr:PREDICTED: protein JTB-like [Acropora digitifera]
MKQWRILVIVLGVIILLLVANFSVQISSRRRRNSSQVSDHKKNTSAAFEKNHATRRKSKRKNNSSAIGDAKMSPNSMCWKNEETQTVGECIHCSDYEERTLVGCRESGNIQLTICIVSNIKCYKSCPHVIEWEEKKFWIFEGLMLLGLMVSSSVVWYRQRQLDNIFYQKLQKQVESDTV